MKQINLYIGKEFLFVFLLCFVSIFAIFYISILLNSTTLLAEQNGIKLFLSTMFDFLPLTIEFIFPLVALISTMFFLFLMSNHSEITAMLSIGMSRMQILKPVLFVLFLLSILFYINQSYFAPLVSSEENFLGNTELDYSYWSFHDNQIYYFRQGSGLILTLDENGSITQQTTFPFLYEQNKQWIAPKQRVMKFYKTKNGTQKVKRYVKKGVVFKQKEYPFLFTETFRSLKHNSFEFLWRKWKKTPAYITKTRDQIRFAAYSKITSTLNVILLPLLIVPFSFCANRRTANHIKSKMVIAFCLSLFLISINTIFVNAFRNGLLSPLVAVLIPSSIILGTIMLAWLFIRN